MDGEGLLSLKLGPHFYTLHFPERGWLAVELLAFLDDILEARDPAGQILKLLGYTLHMSSQAPSRSLPLWVIVDLQQKFIESNSQLLRDIVDNRPLAPEAPLSPTTCSRVYGVLDRHDFTVKLHR